MKVYVNGEFVDQSEAKISVFDHGVLYGDGIFEGIRLYDGCVFRLDEHLERLEYSAKAILLDMPWSRKELSDIVCESCRVNNLTHAYIRLVVTRGEGSLGLSPKSCKHPGIFCIADSIQLYPESYYTEGLKIITVPTQRMSAAALSPMIKSLNYLNNILAKVEAAHLGYIEAVMLNEHGYVAECTGDNLFLLHKGKLYTPAPYSGALRGVTQATAFDIAAELGVEVVPTNLTRYDLWTAEEAFLTGTAAEVVPVVEIDARPIGDGQPGELTRRFIEIFRQRVREDGTKL